MTTKPLYLLTIVWLTLVLFPTVLQAQRDRPATGQWELNASAYLTPPVRTFYQWLLPVGSELVDTRVRSAWSPGFSAAVRYARPLSPRFSWVAGLELGWYSYHFDLQVSEAFRQLGWGGFTDRYTLYELYSFSGTAGLRFHIPVCGENRLLLQPGIVLSYPLRSVSELQAFAIPENRPTQEVFSAQMVNNNENSLLLAARFGLYYQFPLGRGGNSLLIGPQFTYSGSRPLSGAYTVYGDGQLLRGRADKQFIQWGLMVGVGFGG